MKRIQKQKIATTTFEFNDCELVVKMSKENQQEFCTMLNEARLKILIEISKREGRELHRNGIKKLSPETVIELHEKVGEEIYTRIEESIMTTLEEFIGKEKVKECFIKEK